MPGKGGNKKMLAEGHAPYSISIEGLTQFKNDLDLLASNCKQFWGKELALLEQDGAPSDEEQFLRDIEGINELLEHADAFQTVLERKYKLQSDRIELIKQGIMP